MMSFKDRVIAKLDEIKQNKPSSAVSKTPIFQNGKNIAYLRAVTKESARNSQEIKHLAKWRRASQRWFPSQFRVTVKGTQNWATEQLINKEDRILFMIDDLSYRSIGHVGLYRFNWQKKTCEIDNIVRGERSMPGIMTEAIQTLCMWGKKELGVRGYTLSCFADNEKAIALYKRCGFKEDERIPLVKIQKKAAVIWEELPDTTKKAQRYLLHMKIYE